jgi:tetratricopeptide (TPR) repeat protein
VAQRRVGRAREALTAAEAARAIVVGLAATDPDGVDHQRLLSWCYNDIGLLRALQGDGSAGLEALEQSLLIKQKIADRHPDVTEFRRDLALGHSNIGVILRESGRPAESLATQEKALAISESLVAAYPAVTLLQSDLANSLVERGDCLRLLGRTAEARASYERGLSIAEGLFRTDPAVTAHGHMLAGFTLQGLSGLGAVQLRDGHKAEAVSSWRRAIAESDRLRPSEAESLYHLARCHAQLGGVAGASGSGVSAAEGPSELDRAMEILHRSIAAGLHSFDSMRLDPDLDALRPRSDFRLLLLDLAMPADPFAQPR